MKTILYVLVVGSLMFVMLCTRPNICYSIEIVNRYRSNPGRECNTPKYTLVIFDMFRVFCKHNLTVSRVK